MILSWQRAFSPQRVSAGLLALAKSRLPRANCRLLMTKLQRCFGFVDQRGPFPSVSTSPHVSFLPESEVSRLVTEHMKRCHFFLLENSFL